MGFRAEASKNDLRCTRNEYCIGDGASEHFLHFDSMKGRTPFSQYFRRSKHSCKQKPIKCQHWEKKGCTYQSLGCSYHKNYAYNAGVKNLPSFGGSMQKVTEKATTVGKENLADVLGSLKLKTMMTKNGVPKGDMVAFIGDILATDERMTGSYVFSDLSRWKLSMVADKNGQCVKQIGLGQNFFINKQDWAGVRLDPEEVAINEINCYTCKDHQYKWTSLPSNIWNNSEITGAFPFFF